MDERIYWKCNILFRKIMNYYIRKLSNLPNLQKIKCVDDIEELEADVIGQELRTSNNALSFWKCDCLLNTKEAQKAIILSSTAIKAMQFYILSDEIIKKYNLSMDDSEMGETGYIGCENLHSNMINLNYSKIGNILKMLKEVFQDPKLTPKLEKKEVKEYIIEIEKDERLDRKKTKEELIEAIDKYCGLQKEK